MPAALSPPDSVLAYLSRYTHRVAISNSRLIALDEAGVTFRARTTGASGGERQRTMTLAAGEFIRRFLLHVLPKASIASATTACSPAPAVRRARALLAAPRPEVGKSDDAAPADWRPPCPCCGGRMIIIETFERGNDTRAPPSAGSTRGTRTP